MTTSRTVARMFRAAIALEIDAHRSLTFDEVFGLAHDYVNPQGDNAIGDVEDLAADVADMLEDARALA